MPKKCCSNTTGLDTHDKVQCKVKPPTVCHCASHIQNYNQQNALHPVDIVMRCVAAVTFLCFN